MFWFLVAFLLLLDGYAFFFSSGILGCGHYLKTSGKLLYLNRRLCSIFLRRNHHLMMVATRSHDFFLFAVRWHPPAFFSTPFFGRLLLAANQPAIPHIPIPSVESHHIPSVVFTRVCHPQSRSTDFCRSPLSSFGFRRLRRHHSSSANRTLLSNQSSLPLVPFPGNRRPRRFKQHLATALFSSALLWPSPGP